ncbi:putative phosphatase regulatory subunit-domain-containing protein [Boletus edulis BED1]|uniref:Phosphatase regulatory subunit-domain-containing protein n=1 Tax=Boletus edulis BED1 TaxID=1328754 RepID=A0AAD4BJ12_BOLED|nr:putative phosphatase regulatory subunit-domain-containing protein [Boletus edulis BED1]
MSSTTVCVTDTSVIPFPTLDSTHTQPCSTTAGHIPRRSAPSNLSFSDEPSDTDAIQSRFATSVRYDSSSSSSTPSDEIRPTIIPRSKRVASAVQDIFNPVRPAPTPVQPKAERCLFSDLENRKQTPLRDPSDDEDAQQQFPVLRQAPFFKVGKLRLEGSAGKHVRQASDSNLISSRPSVSVTPSANQPPQTIRKKSGQPIKSSLKSARRPDLHVLTNGSFTKSEPATPTQAKAVHFDSKLEHVKLFLAEQKPLAVSRDGSPTSDTSGDEFPSFIYGDSREHKHVKMLLPNMPSSPRKEENVALQELVLSQDQRTITGNVRVRNIAYEKWLAIRFTLDCWQTTSEVTARYDKSIQNGAFDIFTFTIRLHDIWSRIEDKAILIALRYTVAGKEYWDNNAGKNYHVKFILDPPSQPSSAVDNDTSLKDLNSKLEDLVKTKSAPIPITPYRLGRSFSADHQYSSFAKPLSTRDDFASANKVQWIRNGLHNHHTRTKTYPSGVPATAAPTVAPWSETFKADEKEEVTISPRPQLSTLSLGSPTLPSCPETKLPSPDSPTPSRVQDGRERNHRRGFIDRVMEGSPNLRRTPTGSPLKFDVTSRDTAAQLPRTRSYPLITEKPRPMEQSIPKPPLSIQIGPAGDGGSEEPTPSTASQSSSSSNSSSTTLFSPSSGCSRSDTSYKQFLDQFCFYTGADSLLQESSEGLPRSQSTSRIDQYFLSHSPPSSFSSHLPARFPYDSSNSSTPTAVRV